MFNLAEIKNRILLSALFTILMSSASAQSFSNQWILSSYDHNLAASIEGQDIDVLGDGSVIANFKITGSFNTTPGSQAGPTADAFSVGAFAAGNTNSVMNITFADSAGLPVKLGISVFSSSTQLTETVDITGPFVAETGNNHVNLGGNTWGDFGGGSSGWWNTSTDGIFSFSVGYDGNRGQNFRFRSSEIIPEPSSSVIMILGLASVLSRRRR